MKILEIKDLHKKFDDLEVLKGINFSLNKGEVLSIIGSSGSGKTTLLRCLNFLIIPEQGKISVFDENNEEILFDSASYGTLSDKERIKKTKKDLKDGKLRLKRLNFGLVFQSFNLFPQYNVLENIMLAKNLLDIEQYKKERREEKKSLSSEYKKELKGRKKEILKQLDSLYQEDSAQKDVLNERLKDIEIALGNFSINSSLKKMSYIKECNKELAIKLLKAVGLEEKRKAYPHELSGGQCQRVAIARALALSPKILCFDEPTSALDPELTGEVLKVIKSLKSKDRTMIVVTHEMEFAKNISDKVIFMANGVIEEMGTAKQVFDNPKSQKLREFLKVEYSE